MRNNKVIFTDKVSVICIGDVIMKSHKHQVYPSKLLANYKEGDILGFDQDLGESLRSENWCVARCTTLVAEFEFEDFQKIWKILETDEAFLAIQKMKIAQIFYPLSKLILQKIHHEMIESRVYKAGSLICPQNKKSIINKAFYEYYEPPTTKDKVEKIRMGSCMTEFQAAMTLARSTTR
jgi:hypothetical protein